MNLEKFVRNGQAAQAAADAEIKKAKVPTLEERLKQRENQIRDLQNAGERVLKVVEAMMPGVRHIALQDYRELNEAPIALRVAINAAKKGPA